MADAGTRTLVGWIRVGKTHNCICFYLLAGVLWRLHCSESTRFFSQPLGLLPGMKKANAPPGPCFMVNRETSSHNKRGAVVGCPAGRLLLRVHNGGADPYEELARGGILGDMDCGLWCTCSFSQTIVYCKTLRLRNKTSCEKEFGDGASILDGAFSSRVAAGIQLSCPGQLKGWLLCFCLWRNAPWFGTSSPLSRQRGLLNVWRYGESLQRC